MRLYNIKSSINVATIYKICWLIIFISYLSFLRRNTSLCCQNLTKKNIRPHSRNSANLLDIDFCYIQYHVKHIKRLIIITLHPPLRTETYKTHELSFSAKTSTTWHCDGHSDQDARSGRQP